MKFPIHLNLSLSRYLAAQKIRGRRRFPLVLMLEPLHRCNLACEGCGRLIEYRDTLHETMSTDECLEAVEEAGAPVVSLTGGEPLLLDNVGEIAEKILRTGRHIFLCTNGLLLEKSLPKFRPDSKLFFNIHLDGTEAFHDGFVGRTGVYRTAIRAIRAAKKAGFTVCTNTTVYRSTDLDDVGRLFEALARIGVDGFLLSPAYSYEALDGNNFLSRAEIQQKFRLLYPLSRKYPLWSTPLYLKFLMGERDLPCTPWGNPTRNVRGWKSPCYLITDGHYPSFRALMEETDWDRYGVGKDPRCADCMMHSGFEPSAVMQATSSISDSLEMLLWNLT
jgi:hopanoid biosynthesis associated radical SAM protein HpnH